MRLPSACARSTATALFLLALACALTACKRNSTRPERAPTPPLVACDVGPLPQLPPIPALVGMDAWAVEAMALYETVGRTVQAHAACMGKLRKEGVIR